MKIKGTYTENRTVDCDISWNEILKLIEDQIGFGADYIHDGMYYEYQYTHPHNGDHVFDAPRPATSDEIECDTALKLLRAVLVKRALTQ